MRSSFSLAAVRKGLSEKRKLHLFAVFAISWVAWWSLFSVVRVADGTGASSARKTVSAPGSFRVRFSTPQALTARKAEAGALALGQFRVVRAGGEAWAASTADELASTAFAGLLGGRDCDQQAIALLRAARLEPLVATRWNDAAAVRIECADREVNAARRMDDLLRGLALAHRGIGLAVTEELLFNRALALAEVGAIGEASVAWQGYLERDGGSPWAEEAQGHLDAARSVLDERSARFADESGPPTDLATLARTHPSAARRWSETRLLGLWAEAVTAGDESRAETALAAAETVAALLGNEGGRLLAATAEAIRGAQRAKDDARLLLLARGHGAYQEALSFLWAEQPLPANRAASRAYEDLVRADSPLALAVRLLWERAEGHSASSSAHIAYLANGEGEMALEADARFEQAALLANAQRFDAALRVYETARSGYKKLGEWEAVAVMSVFRAEIFAYNNQRHKALEELARALERGPAIADGYLRFSLYVGAASVAEQLGLTATAFDLRLEASAACRWMPERPLCRADSWIRLAKLASSPERAMGALFEAESELRALAESFGKRRSRADLAQAWADWYLAPDNPNADPVAALSHLNQAIEEYAGQRLPILEERDRIRRGEVLAGLGRWEEARADFRLALQGLRRWAEFGTISDVAMPLLARRAFEGSIEAELELAGDSLSLPALQLSEEMRGWLAAPGAAPRRLVEMRDFDGLAASLPAATAVVEFAVLERRAVAWLLTAGEIQQIDLPLATHLGEVVGQLGRARSLRTWRQASTEVRQRVVDPVLARLPEGVSRLVLIPDGELYGVPFRGLWDSQSESYLDERFSLPLVPSLGSLLGNVGEQPAPSATVVAPLLAVGFAEFLDPDLRWLPYARREVQEVAAEYGVALEEGCAVTHWASLRDCMATAEVVHLATHSEARSTLAGGSWLALAGETVNLDQMWRDLPALPHTRLVVLSACQSTATTPGSEGLGGLARPFLVRGVGQVVGSLWKLGDRDAAAFFPTFHRHYQQTGEAAEALRRARQEMTDWANRPWSWAGVVTVGANLEQ